MIKNVVWEVQTAKIECGGSGGNSSIAESYVIFMGRNTIDWST